MEGTCPVVFGYHQDLKRKVYLDHCRGHRLPVSRREVGGGAIYLDESQLLSQWVFHNSALPASLEDQFELRIRLLVATYQVLGIAAYPRPVNDIYVAGKKIGVFSVTAVVDLQAAAHGAELPRDALAERFAVAYRHHAIQAPGVTPEHLADAVLAAVATR